MAEPTKGRRELKQYFVRNAIPTQGNFADLIDGMLNLKEDGVQRQSGGPLCIEAAGHGDSHDSQEVLGLYKNLNDPEPTWLLSLNPASGGTHTPGLSFGQPTGNSRLFIDQATGHLGIGTLSPTSPLTVDGPARVEALGIGAAAPTGSLQDHGTLDSNAGIQIDSTGQILLEGTAPIHYKTFDSTGNNDTTLSTNYSTTDWIVTVGGFWVITSASGSYTGPKIWPFTSNGKWSVSIDIGGLTEASWKLALVFFNRKLFSVENPGLPHS